MNCAIKYCLNDSVRKYCPKCRSRMWRKQNPFRAAYLILKHNAKQRNCIVEITFEEFKQFCIANKVLERKEAGEDLTFDRIKEYVRVYKLSNMQVLLRPDNVRKYFKDKRKQRGWSTEVSKDDVPF